MEAPLPDPETFLRAMARRYVWDQSEADALAFPDRIIRRVMDLGTIDDAFDLEPVFGRDKLAEVLRTSPAGALRPRSWSFWHHRLDLIAPTDAPPPMPVRRVE
jgi:hypothetical protein